MVKDLKILGFNFTQINAEKNPDFSGKLEAKQNIQILSVEKQKLDLVKEDSLKITFEFTVDYSGLGKVKLAGTLFLIIDSKTLKETLKSWEEEKIPEDLRLSILNIIMQRASLRAFQIEEDLGLPLHIPLPRLQIADKKQE